MTEQSEFGKGLVVNLVKFFEHFSDRMLRDCYSVSSWMDAGMKEVTPRDYGIRYFNSIKYFKSSIHIYGSPEKALSHSIELWANGASDHLYDIQVPKEWRKLKVAKLVSELKELGLTMGHGFTGKKWTIENITKMRELTEQICLWIDKRIGIKEGDWGEH